MKRPLSSYKLAWILICTATLGISISALLTRDMRWTQWHLSRLGEGHDIAAAIFNLSFSIAAIILTLLAIRLTDEITARKPHKGTTLLRTILIFVALCWAGIASFSSDYFIKIHNVFGYGQFFLMAYLMLNLKKVCPRFSDTTYTLGIGAALLISGLLGMYHLMHFTTLVIVELIGAITLFVWLISLTADQRK